MKTTSCTQTLASATTAALVIAASAFGQVGEESVLPNEPRPAHHIDQPPFDQWPVLAYPPVTPDHDVNRYLPGLWVTDTLDPPTQDQHWLARFEWTGLDFFPSLEHASACVHGWHPPVSLLLPLDPGWAGARPNLDPLFGVEPATLPPLSSSVATSSTPLIPAGRDGGHQPMLPIASRELAGGSVDLVTGVALLSATDFELPFGGATFRYHRTYSDSASLNRGDYYEYGQALHPVWQEFPLGRLWDWHGVGWMLSHNPILLIDAGFPGMGGARIQETSGSQKLRYPRRCYFIPDAHHAIPFDFLKPEGGLGPRYEAPARFGATIEPVGGTWSATLNNGVGGWSVFPHTFHVWLHNGAVKYTFKPIYEDVRRWTDPLGLATVSSHDPASDAGVLDWANEQELGVPYLGLCVQIEDRYGNKIVNQFCGFHQYDCNLAQVAHGPPAAGDPPRDPQASGSEPGAWPVVGRADQQAVPGWGLTDRQAACQSCHRKGQLDRTFLFPADSATPEWTIVYSHRTFLGADVWSHPVSDRTRMYPYNAQTAIKTVRVYDGERTGSECLTVDFRRFLGGHTDFWSYLPADDSDPALPYGESDWTQDQFTWGHQAYDPDALLDALLGRLGMAWDARHPGWHAVGTEDDWLHEVQYLYSDGSDLFRYNDHVFPASFTPTLTADEQQLDTIVSPRLLLAESRTRVDQDAVADDPIHSSFNVYRYIYRTRTETGSITSTPKGDTGSMSAIYEPRTIAAIADRLAEVDDPEWPWHTPKEVALLLLVEDFDRALPSGPSIDADGEPTIREIATKYFAYWPGDDDEDPRQALGVPGAAPESSLFLVSGIRRPAAPLSGRNFGRVFAADDSLQTGLEQTYFQEMVQQIGVSDAQDDLILVLGDVPMVSNGRSAFDQPTHKIFRFVHAKPGRGTVLEGHRPKASSGHAWPFRVALMNSGSGGSESDFEGSDFSPHRSLFHFPHRMTQDPSQNWDEDGMVAFDGGLNRPLWYAVIDEFPNQSAALLPNDAVSGFEAIPSLYPDPSAQPQMQFKPTSRRIVALNAMGYKVWERLYTIKPDGISLEGGSGHRMVYRYDDLGRVTMIKSYGWSAAELLGEQNEDPTIPETQGLVTVFDYDYGLAAESDSPLTTTMEPRRIGVRWGDNAEQSSDPGEVQWLQEFYRDSERPEIILAEVTFEDASVVTPVFPSPTKPPAGLSPGAYEDLRNAIFHDVSFVGGASGLTKKEDWRASYRSAAQLEPGGPKLHAVEFEQYDDVGRVFIKGRGLDDLSTSVIGDSVFYVDWVLYDRKGRPVIQVQDAEPGTQYTNVLLTSVSGTCPTGGSLWQVQRPIGPDGVTPIAAASRETHSRYGARGLKRVRYPDGSQKHIHHRRLLTGEDETLVFEGPLVGSPTSTEFDGRLTKVSRTVSDDGRVLIEEQLVLPEGSQPGTTISIATVDTLVAESSLTPSYDSAGQVTTVDMTASGEDYSAERSLNMFGTVHRQREADGTITRMVHDQLGREIRSYRGTSDWGAQFGAPPGTPPGLDDMALVSVQAYGSGIRDAMLLTHTHTFRDHPPAEERYNPDPLALEPFGELEAIGYDWRMRETLRVQFDAGGAARQATQLDVTYMDAMGRPRFIATFDGCLVAGETEPTKMLDLFVPGAFEPSGASIPDLPGIDQLLTPMELVSLSEIRYDDRGNTSEHLEYDLEASTPSAPLYTASRSYFDHDGRPVWSSAPSGGVTRTWYDAHGREVARSTYAGGLEMHRVVSTFERVDHGADPAHIADQVMISTTYDRIDGAAGSVLTESNAVVTQTHSWYVDGRLVCTAQLGTGPATPAVADAYATPITRTSRWGSRGQTPPIVFNGDTFVQGDMVGYEHALLTAYGYDEAGNQEYVLHPDMTITRSLHDGWGNAVLVQEGITLPAFGGAMTAPLRATVHEYDAGRLVATGTILAPHPAATDPVGEPVFTSADGHQVTHIEYGADIVRPTGTVLTPSVAVISKNNQWISAIRMPGDEAPAGPSYAYQYYADGSLATRTDARGITLYYLYDYAGRLEHMIASYGDSQSDPFDGGDVVPADRITRVHYTYDDATGLMLSATAYSVDDADVEFEVSQNTFEYDKNQRLVMAFQQRGDEVDPLTSPFTEYVWSVGHAGADAHDTGYSRLASMTYPVRWDDGSLPDPLTLGFGYGQPGDADDILSRITEIANGTFEPAVPLARFAHTGSGMQVRRSTHDASGNVLATEGYTNAETPLTGYTQFDRFGRLIDTHWRDGSPTPGTLYRAQHTLDAAGQRIGSDVSRVDLSTSTPELNTNSWAFGFDALRRLEHADLGQLSSSAGVPAILSPTIGHAWTLDELSNWTGDGTDPGLAITGVGARDVTHAIGDANAIDSVTIDGTTPTPMVYDRAGNLVYDGTYWYRYDAWHRLIQIVEAPAGGYTFDANGKKDGSGPAFADVVAVYAYDGLGRLVGRQAPYPGTTDEWRTETYLYDGDRRIAERWRDPIISNNGGGANGFQQQAATHTLWTEREYVHTPGYIDEFVGEIDANGDLWPILQDANQNAIAMLDGAGAIVRQRILSPYGRVISSEIPTGVTPPKSRIGHQGLFADRLNAPTTLDPLDTGSHNIWHNRNRTLLPELGRFAQRDPNATGQGASSMLDMYGSALHDGVSPPDPAALFGDGQNIYAYAVANPTQLRDPSGLFIGAVAFFMPGPSDFITGALEGLVNEYAANLEWDLDWAMDWSLPDDLHTRGNNDWMAFAMMQGVYDSYYLGIPGTDIGFNPLDAFAGRGKPSRIPGSGHRRGAGNLDALGLTGVNLRMESLSTGAKQLKRNGFAMVPSPRKNGVTFEHPRTGAKVHYDRDSGAGAYTGPDGTREFRKRNHWHIEDYQEKRYDWRGRPVDSDTPAAHIRAR
ncbi:MAG: hypothetical protein RIB58_12550 [Phycisphaerales bacterium]